MTASDSDDPVEVIVYPLVEGEMLANRDWFPFYFHRFEQSDFVLDAIAAGRLDRIGVGLMLWCAAMRQDPAGTLPDHDGRLAYFARVPAPAWAELRPAVLAAWRRVVVETRSGGSVHRLTHPTLMQIAVDQMERRRGFEARREAEAVRKTRERVRKKLAEMGVPAGVASDATVERLAEWVRVSGIWITLDNMRIGLTDVIGVSGDVIAFNPRKRNRKT